MKSRSILNQHKLSEVPEGTSSSFPFLFILLLLLINLPTIPIIKIQGLYQPVNLDLY